MTIYVLDTNVVSFIVKEHPLVTHRYELLARPENKFLGCPLVWFEVRRGLIAKDAKNQMLRFEIIFAAFDWEDYSRADWELAAQLWAQRKVSGRPIHDADLLIAVFAMNRNAVFVTDNEKDFDGLGVTVENWKQT